MRSDSGQSGALPQLHSFHMLSHTIIMEISHSTRNVDCGGLTTIMLFARADALTREPTSS